MLAALTLVLVFAAAPASRAPDGTAQEVLSLIVFGQGPSDEAKLLTADVPAAVRTRLDEYLAKRWAFRSRMRKPSLQNGSLSEMVHMAAVQYERQLASIAVGDRAPEVAAAYVRDLHPCYEWEGFHDCPAREALFAERYVVEHPQSPLAEYLPLLAAHRWACAAEAYDYEAKEHFPFARRGAGLQAAQRQYERDLARAVASSDPLVQYAAGALRQRGGCF